jgi:hypothetical protein
MSYFSTIALRLGNPATLPLALAFSQRRAFSGSRRIAQTDAETGIAQSQGSALPRSEFQHHLTISGGAIG